MERARAEADAVLGDGRVEFEQLARLPYIEQVLNETLRLYPTAPAFAVTPRQDTLLAGRYPVQPGEALLLLLPQLHRDPQVWRDPEAFDPDRFAPEARAALPDHAFMPFGNGMRGCIGRVFAMQEAKLVLAMLLRRFDLRETWPYALRIKEALTLKPDGLRVHARLRTWPAPRAAQPPPLPSPAAQPAAAAHGTPLLVLYGSNAGSAEGLARRLAGDAAARGYAATLLPMDAAVSQLPRTGGVIIVTASYNGQPPDNARAFCAWLATLPAGALLGMQATVFGCGNRDWRATYQQVPTQVEALLTQAGASVMAQRGEADARGNFFADFERWCADLWPAVDGALGVRTTRAHAAVYSVSVAAPGDAAGSGDAPETFETPETSATYATVVVNRELVDLTAAGARSKRHLELRLPAGMAYLAGDYLAVRPENTPEQVAAALRLFNLPADARLTLHSPLGALSGGLPLERPLRADTLFARHLDLGAPPTRGVIARLAEANRCPPHRAELMAWASDVAAYERAVWEPRVSLLELLTQFGSCEVRLEQFLELAPGMAQRLYSIASSPRVEPTGCALAVAVAVAARPEGGVFRGTCSRYLASLTPGQRIAVEVRSPCADFRPPQDNDRPMLLVAAGTGIAPFRAFLQERAARRAAGEAAGATLLFFGVDHPEVDYLYRDELEAWQREGWLQVLPAFSRQPEGGITFVQHRLWAARAQVQGLLGRKAVVYVCGDGRRMAPAVRETMLRILREGMTWEGRVEDLERQGRYVVDVFG